MTRISIVTPSLNQGCYLIEALESVRLQNHQGTEHLIVDGGSIDKTVPLLQSLSEQKDWSHIHWTSGPDGGQSEALNRGFTQVQGDIIGWLNSDDRYRPGCFDHVIKAFDENSDVDVFYGDYTIIDHDGGFLRVRREIGFNRFILLYHRVLYIPTPSTFFRRRIFEDGNLLRRDLHYAMDYEFFLRLANSGYCIRHLPTVLADFRLHSASKSCTANHLQADEKEQVMRSISPLSSMFRSPHLRSVAFLTLQFIAGLLRWSEKTLRGYYFRQFRVEL
jgi:glycosyltransferase involved in cell wall biosynthesis